MGKKIGVCQLCKMEKKLIKAHVISKALFKDIFNIDDRVHLLSPTELDKQNLVQDAFYDTGILCGDCDSSFSLYENYFAQIVRGNLLGLGIRRNGQLTYSDEYSLDLLEGIDHYKLRMFFLITIWRCSISTQPSFKQINLAEREKGIFEQIRSGKTTSYDKIPVILISLEEVNDIRKEVAMTPAIGYLGQHQVAFFVLRGWAFVYNLSSFPTPHLFEYRLSESKDFKIIKFSHRSGVVFLNKMTPRDWRF